MRKLKLEMQISLDGFCGDINGSTSWMVWDWQPRWNWDKNLQRLHTQLQTSSDTILLSRKMAAGRFFDHWEKIAENKKGPQFQFANAINTMKKVVPTNKLKESPWKNTELVSGNLAKEIQKLKRKKGKDIIVYGGASFVASLIRLGLIDEYYFIVNPIILGKGKAIFKDVKRKMKLQLVSSIAYNSGITVLRYKNAKIKKVNDNRQTANCHSPLQYYSSVSRSMLSAANVNG